MSQWMNTAEKSIRELKKETGRGIMIATGTPKRLWDDRPDYRAYLDGQVPETVMTGQPLV
jgi:hypothetical protein